MNYPTFHNLKVFIKASVLKSIFIRHNVLGHSTVFCFHSLWSEACWNCYFCSSAWCLFPAGCFYVLFIMALRNSFMICFSFVFLPSGVCWSHWICKCIVVIKTENFCLLFLQIIFYLSLLLRFQLYECKLDIVLEVTETLVHFSPCFSVLPLGQFLFPGVQHHFFPYHNF